MATTIVHPSSRRLWELAERQHGVVTRQQLLAADLTDAAIRHRLAIGRLHTLRRGVYAVGRPQTSREGTWLAALLSCGAHSALSHASGLALCRVRSGLGPQVIDVSVPRQLRRRQPNVRLHRLKRGTEEIRIRDGIPVLSPARLLLNAAATVSIQQLERDINIADAQGLISVDALGRAIRGFRHEPGVAALRAVVLGHTFTLTDSELERIFLPVARSAELPDPLTRRYVNGFRVDFFWPDLAWSSRLTACAITAHPPSRPRTSSESRRTRPPASRRSASPTTKSRISGRGCDRPSRRSPPDCVDDRRGHSHRNRPRIVRRTR